MNADANNRRGRVTGSISALTSFLREKGIQPRNIPRRAVPQGQTAANTLPSAQTQPPPHPPAFNVNDQHEEGIGMEEYEEEDNESVQAESSTSAATRQSKRRRSNQSRVTANETITIDTNQTVTLAYSTRSRARSNSVTNAKTNTKKRKAKDLSLNDDFSDEDFIPIAKPRRSNTSSSRVEFCTQCHCRFTVTNNEAQLDPDNLLCPTCIKGGSGAILRKTLRRRPKTAKGKMAWEDPYKCSTLLDICIQLIAKYIDDVEALGDISEVNMDKIAKIICKNRQLNNQNVGLFLGPKEGELKLYDCTNLDETGLLNIAHFSPNLYSLHLRNCGQLQDNVLNKYAIHLTGLRSLQLYGAFLVSADGWRNLFETVGVRLENFTMAQSHRLNLDSVKAMVQHCSSLKEIRLLNCGHLDSSWLELISQLKLLEIVDISNPGGEVTSESLIELLNAIGSSLRELNLGYCTALEDSSLTDGILPCCVRLQSLCLEGCDNLTDKGVATFFRDWRHTNKGLTHINLGFCTNLGDETLKRLVEHSHNTLQTLSVHSCDTLTDKAFACLAGETPKPADLIEEPSSQLMACKELRELDTSFVRCVDDIIIEKLMHGCEQLSKLSVWGCHKVTECAEVRNEVKLIGRECN